MSNETRMILDMLREGRITATEAANLLEALGPKHTNSPQGANPAQLARAAKAEIKAELKKAKQETREVIRDLRDDLHDSRRDAKASDEHENEDHDEESRPGDDFSGLGKLVSGLVSGWTGSAYQFSEEESGRLPASELVRVIIRGVNGRIVVTRSSSEDDTWRLVAEKAVRAASEAAAKSSADGLYSVQTTDRELVIQAKKVFGQSMSVNFELSLPPGRRYQMDLDSTNGSIEVGDLAVEVAKVTTTNGKIRVSADGEEFSLRSTNGRVELTGCVKNAICRTVNGRIVLECESPVPGVYDLSTVNGSISVRVGAREELGTRFSGEARTGSVIAHLTRHKVILDERRRLGRKLVLEREGIGGELLDVRAKSVVGSITMEEI